jgi:hypothetical protein
VARVIAWNAPASEGEGAVLCGVTSSDILSKADNASGIRFRWCGITPPNMWDSARAG